MKTLLIILITLFANISYSNDYFNALELFNKRKINESVKLFQNVANDKKNPKRRKTHPIGKGNFDSQFFFPSEGDESSTASIIECIPDFMWAV